MPALREVEPHHRLAGLEEGEVDGGIRGRTRVRLHIRVVSAEEQLGAVDRDLFDLVDHLAAAIVALPRQTLGVLVRERRPHGLEHRRRDEVLARDQLEPL